ncbi:MAG: type II secretion system protein [Cyanobacteria bacterium SID2]|nr:type II secretion system protein [Cyanobacteria bacterium SID2]MBP0005512.1 type II secretion system protein [Cyanobacteria bacterium SBC]
MRKLNLSPQLQSWRNRSNSSQAGLTLVEGLVAILVVSAVTVSLTPAIFLAVATRVQNRRAEQAIQLAHGQIDQVRVLIEQGIQADTVTQLPFDVGESTDLTQIASPSSAFDKLQSTNFECSVYDRAPTQVPVESALPVDVNGDCEEDFFVQTFRANDQTVSDDGQEIPIIFDMGVRVYYKNARFGTLETEEASLQLTNGEGQQTSRPLAVLYTTLAQADRSQSLRKYRCMLGDEGSCD